MRLPGVALLVPIAAAIAQERPVRWTLESRATPVVIRASSATSVVVVARIDTGWKLYSLNPQVGGPIATAITLGDSAFVLGEVTAPPPRRYPDRNFNIMAEIYTEAVRFEAPVRAHASTKSGARDLVILVQFQTCTDRYCLPPRTDTLPVRARVIADASSAALARTVPPAASPAPTTARAPLPAPVLERADFVAPTDLTSLLAFVWLAVTMGLLSLLTPCILPMIPITVSYFGRDADGSRGARTRAALAHAIGIVSAFTLLGFVVSVTLGAGEIVHLAANPWLNAAIAALFIAFALNLLGLFEITLPQRLLTGVSQAGSGRAAGALVIGNVFAITSFTCTVPFIGTLLVLATQGTWRWPLLGLAAYGAAFAIPFVVLALAPRVLDRVPRGGPWMLMLKSSFAVVELALAIKFLSNVDLVLGLGVLTREVVNALWIVAAVTISAICLLRARGQRLQPGRFAASAAALGIAVWLSGGLRGKRLGELEAYLPPHRADLAARRITSELSWLHDDYAAAVARARAEQKPIMLDFTGYTCTNCRWMEANMFPRDDVRALLSRYVRVRLYTDGLGEPFLSQQRMQLERFGSIGLPYYALLDARGTPIATFLGMTRDSREFGEFLEKGLAPR